MKITFEQTIEDVSDLTKMSFKGNRRLKIIGIVMGVLLVFGIIGTVSVGDMEGLVSILMPVAIIGALWLFFFKYWQNKIIMKPGNKEMMLGQRELDFTEEHISLKTDVSEAKFQWVSITDLKQSDRNYFLYLGSVQAILVAKRAFDGEIDRSEFETFVSKMTGKEFG